MSDAISFLISGIILGLAAGISPGPLLTLVISETLKHDRKAGIAVAMAPVLTDLPIVVISLYFLAKIAHSHLLLGAMSIMGACFIGYLAYESITVKGTEPLLPRSEKRSLRKGIITNFLSPHPYLFWIMVGAPTVLRAYAINFMSSLFFISGFYAFLVGSKIAVALIVHTSRPFLNSHHYLFTIRLLGVILLVLALVFLKDGLQFLGIL